jgi:LacI family transcriptional regulator
MYIQETTFDKLGGLVKTSVLLRMRPQPTAIFAGNDMIAFGVLLALRDSGLRCPQDVSLIGFDDLDIAEMTNPQLSSVHQPSYQLGTTAARLLLERVAGSTSAAKHTGAGDGIENSPIRGSSAATRLSYFGGTSG